MIKLIALLLALAPAHAQVQVMSSGPAKVPTSTVAGLPTCNAAAEGSVYGVTDALAPAVLIAVAGSGAVHTLVYCNGTSWIVG